LKEIYAISDEKVHKRDSSSTKDRSVAMQSFCVLFYLNFFLKKSAEMFGNMENI